MNEREATLDPTNQLVIIARLSEFCQFRGRTLNERDPWAYMRDKLLQIEAPLLALKSQLLASMKKHLLEDMRAGGMDDERFADYKMLFEHLVSRGDFADLAIHLSLAAGPGAVQWVADLLPQMKAANMFDVERLPAAERGSSWEKLVKELQGRLYLDVLEKVLARKPRTAKRKAYVLRKLRAIVAEYCTVMHIPITAEDTFTPFMLPRVEALVAANLRLLNKYR